VIARLLAQQRIYAPAAINPNFQSCFLELRIELNSIEGCHARIVPVSHAAHQLACYHFTMIIRPLDLKEKALYDSVATHPLQSWDWGEFRRKTGVDVERYGIFDGAKMIASMQVSFHKIPYTSFTAGYFPKGTMPTEEQLHALADLGRRKKAIYVKLEPNVAAPVASQNAFTAIRKFLEEHHAVPGRPLFTRYTFQLDLRPSEDELLNAMKPKTRYNIHLAERKEVKIYEDTTEQGIGEYLEILKETTRRQGFYAHNEKYFRAMWDALKDTGMMHIFKAVYQDKTIVVWIVFIFNGVMYYPYGASSSAYREVMASNLMMWKVIQYGKSQGCHLFDMWGSLGPNADPTSSWFGFHKFKEGYGGTLTEFVGTYDLVVMPQLYTLYRIAEDWRWKILRFKAKILK
jgi:lipid II:glycine glycyltransferase (peptidoglycan interpeptide bridge formation enzyme)